MSEGKGREFVLGYKEKELSIIIPVYNTEPYLRRCLDSVVSATKRIKDRIEVLIINDGSTDGSPVIIEEYCNKYEYLVQYNKENGGLSDVKNYGLKYAQGRYVIFLDSDDYVDENMYDEMLETLHKENADVVVCDIELTYDDPKKNVIHSCTVQTRTGIFHQVIDMTMMPASWNKIVKKELYDGLSFPVGKNNEDVAVTPIVLARAKKIAAVNKPFYKYYQREGSIQNSGFSEKRFVILDTAEICMQRLQGLDDAKVEQIKGSVYLHQILALPMYPIRREPFKKRHFLLVKYMKRVKQLFPDIWDICEIKEFVTWDTKWVQWSRKVSIFMLKHGWYFCLCIFWSICNVGYDCLKAIYDKIRN